MIPGIVYPTEKELILSGNWPFYPILPMKRQQPGSASRGLESIELGVMLAGEWSRVYIGNLFFPGPKSLEEIRRTFPCRIYADLDAALAAGWHGD